MTVAIPVLLLFLALWREHGAAAENAVLAPPTELIHDNVAARLASFVTKEGLVNVLFALLMTCIVIIPVSATVLTFIVRDFIRFAFSDELLLDKELHAAPSLPGDLDDHVPIPRHPHQAMAANNNYGAMHQPIKTGRYRRAPG